MKYTLQLFFVYTTIRAMNEKIKKRGRPSLENSASSTLPPIRITLEEKQKFREAAESAGMSLSAWLKSIARERIGNTALEKNTK